MNRQRLIPGSPRYFAELGLLECERPADPASDTAFVGLKGPHRGAVVVRGRDEVLAGQRE